MQGKIVAAVYYEGSIIIFTEHGYIYEMTKNHTGQFAFRLIYRMSEI